MAKLNSPPAPPPRWRREPLKSTWAGAVTISPISRARFATGRFLGGPWARTRSPSISPPRKAPMEAVLGRTLFSPSPSTLDPWLPKFGAVFAAFLTTLLFSISVVCGHRSAKLIGGTEANFWRLTCATIMLGVWAYGFGNGLAGDAFPLFLLSGILGIGVGDVALFQALPRLGSRLSLLLIQCLTAPFGALIEWGWLGTRVNRAQILSGTIILAGVGFALAPAKHLRIARRELVVGTIAALLAALGGACGAVMSRKAFEVSRLNHEPIDGGNAAFQRLTGGLFIGGICLLIVKRREFLVQSRAPR